MALLGAALACGGDETPTPDGAAMGAAPGAEAAESPDLEEATSGLLNEPPTIEEVTLRPSQPRPGEVVTAQVAFDDPEGDDVELSYEWRVDGSRTGETGENFRVSGEAKNALIEVIVVARDDEGESDPERATARIGNLPPQMLGIVLEPLQDVTVGHDVLASPRATDPDGDEIEYRYTWWVNDNVVGDDAPVLESRHFQRGDRISLRVTASDGQEESEPLESDNIVVGNAAPRITSVPDKSFDDQGVFRYAVKAEDPDGDRVFRYELLEGPDGMRIDTVSGDLEWTPSEQQAGKHPVQVEVSDRRGGTAKQNFDVQVAFEEQPAEEASPAAPAPDYDDEGDADEGDADL